MFKPNQDGFSVVEAVIVIIILGLIGGAGYLVYSRQSDHKDGGSGSSNDSSQSQQSKLEEIKDKVGQLNHRSDDTNVENKLKIQTKLDNPPLTLVLPAAFQFVFNASLYANNPNIAPVGGQGPNGSGADQALDRSKVDAILTDAGLKKTSTEGAEPVVTIIYESDAVLCNVTDSQGLAKVSCADKAAVNAIVSEAKNALDALKKAGANTTSDDHGYYTQSSDGSIKGLQIDNVSGLKKGLYGAYLVNMGGSWSYIGSDTAGAQTAEPPCDAIAKPEYKNVFVPTYSNVTCE